MARSRRRHIHHPLGREYRRGAETMRVASTEDLDNVRSSAVPLAPNSTKLFELGPEIREFLALETARSGMNESVVVTFALGLLAYYRRETADGSSIVLGPPDGPEASPIAFEATTAAVTSDWLAALLGPSTYEFRMGGFDVAAESHLQVVSDRHD
jgi:hypothetical protein